MKIPWKVISRKLLRINEFTIAGFFAYLSLKLSKKELMIVGACHCCGACCRSLSLDSGGGWIKKRKDFDRIVADNPQYHCLEQIGKDSRRNLLFCCSWLSADGTCSNYDGRFDFCRDFPDKNLVFCGGGLPSGCGYSFKPVVPFSQILQETIDNK
ncbi:hypothetical protein [Desulforhopalus sp. IMCC35007]|uniref:hypothetical protein n=1 Tax=Desulforhopalus sp. IMCC35007 TaxID=2569543 RepID=UPI0010ADCF4C|nr:hypothetical protein [Desulforhopalus sp. IMCC35007]TKB09321.1 hypothetical protein FCL48_10215 [Desulforhopalus sp. IMCC35007]